jgi:hypothetical protein
MMDAKIDASRAPLVRGQELRRADAEYYGPWSPQFPHRADLAEVFLARGDERVKPEVKP